MAFNPQILVVNTYFLIYLKEQASYCNKYMITSPPQTIKQVVNINNLFFIKSKFS
jgi:hypothetical protein